MRRPHSQLAEASWGLSSLALVVGGIVLPSQLGAEHRLVSFWGALGMFALAFAVCGVALGRGPWGVFVDSRNRVSLSRVQAALWTVILLGGFAAAVMANVAAGDREPLDISIPTGLLLLAGISSASMVGSPVIKSTQREKTDIRAFAAVADEAAKSGRKPDSVRVEGLLAVNARVEDAKWTDMIQGEQAGSFATVDIGKTQLLLMTLLTAAVYVTAMAQVFSDPDVAYIGTLPEMTEGMNVLLGISHTGYLATKAIPRASSTPG